MDREKFQQLHDCYFYYYSTCRKGDTCTFRHEPAALGLEEACQNYLEGNCFDRTCSKRHMKIQKPRKDTPCYWEGQPTGCKKPHCVFAHRNPRNFDATVQVPTSNGILQMPPAGGLIMLPRML